MDELIVYDRVLTGMEIQQLFQMGEDGISVLPPEKRPDAP